MKKLMIFGDSIIKGVTYSGQSYHLCQNHDFDTIAAQGVTVENHARMGATIDVSSGREAHYIPRVLPTVTPVPTATPTLEPSPTPEP